MKERKNKRKKERNNHKKKGIRKDNLEQKEKYGSMM